MRLYSWNVNGLRSIAKKGFFEWLKKTRPDVVGLQEVRARPEQLDDALCSPRVGRLCYRAYFQPAERPGYSGVGLLTQSAPDHLEVSLGEPAFDGEGRFQLARFGRLLVGNAYFPNGAGKDRDNSRIPFKLAFTDAVFRLLDEEKERGTPILVMGDFNTAHQEIDLARPKQNVKTSGFTPIEREALDRWVQGGWVDTFRLFEKGGGHYTWWSQRKGVRERNIGWRIDYVFASPGAVPYVKRAWIEPEVMGSDHCPIGVKLDDAVLG